MFCLLWLIHVTPAPTYLSWNLRTWRCRGSERRGAPL